MPPPPSYTDRQLKTVIILKRLRMITVFFYTLLFVFLGILGLFLFFVFTEADWQTKTILGVLDGIVGWALKPLTQYLFNDQDISKV